MFKSVLLPLDGSVLAARALPYAKRVARAAGARLIVVRAHLPADDLGLRLEYPELSPAERADVERTTAEAEFRTAVDGLRRKDLDVEAYFVEGGAADVIYETAASTQANLIVMSTHGHGGLGRWLYGSVADEVLGRVPVPVLFVSAVCTQLWPRISPLRVVAPLDGSDLADRPPRRGSIWTKWPQDCAPTNAPAVSTRIAHGDAASQICAVAQEVSAGAIAMATHGPGRGALGGHKHGLYAARRSDDGPPFGLGRPRLTSLHHA